VHLSHSYPFGCIQCDTCCATRLNVQQVKLLMFDVIPGNTLHVKEANLGMDPTPGISFLHIH
jgi:hypothetical protein